jgi:hypothetical protein
MGSAPFALFARVIFAPVFSGAYSGSTAFFKLAHKAEITDRVAHSSPEIAGPSFRKFLKKRTGGPTQGRGDSPPSLRYGAAGPNGLGD